MTCCCHAVSLSVTGLVGRPCPFLLLQVMAEGEQLSKKQAVLEGTIKKLRAQVWSLLLCASAHNACRQVRD